MKDNPSANFRGVVLYGQKGVYRSGRLHVAVPGLPVFEPQYDHGLIVVNEEIKNILAEKQEAPPDPPPKIPGVIAPPADAPG